MRRTELFQVQHSWLYSPGYLCLTQICQCTNAYTLSTFLDDPKHLFVRLFLRNQKHWFRQSKLEGHYREIEDLEFSIRQLITAGLLMDQESVTVPGEVLGTLTMDELKILSRRVGIKEKLSGKPVCLVRLFLQKGDCKW